MENVSAFGLVLTVVASNTFPTGFTITQFADDSDPFDIPELTISDSAMGVNGDLVTWSKANPIKIKMGVIAGSADDLNLAILLEANRVGRGKSGAQDTITVTGIYPNGATTILSPGVIETGPPSSSAASSGRLKSKVYGFAFENRIGTGS